VTKRARIRIAKFGDIPAIFDMINEGHARSRYAGLCNVDEKRAKGIAMNAIQRHGLLTEGGCFVAVADGESGVEGFIIGILQPLYQVLDVLEATDLFWYARPNAHGATAARLLRVMHKWALSSPHVQVIRQGNSDAISDMALSGRILQRAGMRLTGNVYEKERSL
jgi:hypothetical protein